LSKDALGKVKIMENSVNLESPYSIIVDEPETANVVLDLPKYANTIADMILNSKPKFTVAIFGEWGTGKSTLMLNIENILKEKGCNCVQFNPWRFERDEALATIPLVLTIIGNLTFKLKEKNAEFLNQPSEKNKHETLGEKIKRVFSGLSLNFNFGIIGATYDFSKPLSDDKEESGDKSSVSPIQKTTVQEGLDLINELLEKLHVATDNKLKLVVFVDDLDRCTPEKAVEVLESIKIFFDIEGIVFVLALSKGIIVAAIDEKNKYFKDKFNGEDYLKKIIQLPVSIPVWTDEDIRGYLVSILDHYVSKHYQDIFRDNFDLIVQAVERNPREIKRFLNNFILANEIFGFTTNKEFSEFLAIQALHFRWEWFYTSIYESNEIRKKIKKILNARNTKKFKLKKDSVEKRILDDYQLVNFLTGAGKIIFDIVIEDLLRYRRAVSSFNIPLTRETSDLGVQKFHTLPNPTGLPPYHLSLGDVLTAEKIRSLSNSESISFHVAGSTGGIKIPEPQQRVADAMAYDLTNNIAKPAFFYHLGDVIYYYGEASGYYSQFYGPYQHYTAPIFAIPGNHDGDVAPGDNTPSLAAFLKNFCSKDRVHAPEAGSLGRTTMAQPNVYWTLVAPYVTIIGLYSNVPMGGAFKQDQIDWFVNELKTAPENKALIVSVHHDPFSLDSTHSGSKIIGQMLDESFTKSGRVADLVLSSHVHNYQRFTRTFNGRHIPYIVVGAGGYPKLHSMQKQPDGKSLRVPYTDPSHSDVTLENYNSDHNGYMILQITPSTISGEYYIVPKQNESWQAKSQKIDRFGLDLQQHLLTENRSPDS